MRCKEAKQNLLLEAVRHYKKSTALFTFISLYDDAEPYPIEEVIYALECKCRVAQREIDNRPNSPNQEALETIYFTTKKNLEMMQKVKQKIDRRRK